MARVGRRTSGCKQAWAARHGYAYKCNTEWRPCSHPSWQKLRIVSDALTEYERVVWLDADVVITNPMISADDLGVPGAPLTVSRDVFRAAREPDVPHYFSMGNFVMIQGDAATDLLRRASEKIQYENKPYWDQTAMWDVSREIGISHIAIRPRRVLNSVPMECHSDAAEPWQPGDFLAHFTGLSNDQRLQCIPRFLFAGVMAMSLPPPEVYDIGQAIDVRHVALLTELLARGKWERALEIGCFDGVSSIAFADAARKGTVGSAHFCDVKIRDTFRAVISDANNCVVHEMDSFTCLRTKGSFDFVFIDGNHEWCPLETEWSLLKPSPPRMLVAHDVCSTIAGYGKCAGPSWLWQQLQAEGWLCLVDARRRRLEKTQRGLLIATREPELYELARQCFEMTCLH